MHLHLFRDRVGRLELSGTFCKSPKFFCLYVSDVQSSPSSTLRFAIHLHSPSISPHARRFPLKLFWLPPYL